MRELETVLDSIEFLNLQMLIRLILLLVIPSFAFGQLPESDIYHFNLTKVGKSYRIKSPQFLTGFNMDGYNNQPAFFDDKVVYFSTDYYDEGKTEIAKFDFFSKTLTRITYTDEKEYSPTPVPGREAFSVIRVEEDDSQSLSLYPLDGIGYAKRYMNNTSNIGYHTWLDESTVALFLVEAPHHNLALADAKSERRKIILDNIGRCLKVNRSGKLVFVHKQSPEEWYIKSYNAEESKSTIITKTLTGAEDFELLSDGTILMGSGSKLFGYSVAEGKWKEIADLSESGVTNIKRLASRRNSLIVVNEG